MSTMPCITCVNMYVTAQSIRTEFRNIVIGGHASQDGPTRAL